MILDSTLRLEMVLDAIVATNELDITVDYIQWNNEGVPTQPSPYRSVSNGTTDVIILPAPMTPGYRNEPIRVAIYNKDTATRIVTVKTDNGSTQHIDIRKSMGTLTSLIWEKNVGWYTV